MEILKGNPYFDRAWRHKNFIKFVLVGGTNTLIDLVLYSIFANLLSITPVLASVISTGITLIFSFYMNHTFVFRSNKRKRHTALYFILITLFNVWLVQSLVIYIAIHLFDHVSFFQQHEWTFNLFAKLCGVSVSMMFNYFGYKTIFKDLNPAKEQYDKE